MQDQVQAKASPPTASLSQASTMSAWAPTPPRDVSMVIVSTKTGTSYIWKAPLSSSTGSFGVGSSSTNSSSTGTSSASTPYSISCIISYCAGSYSAGLLQSLMGSW
jgi:hypothetical protein